MVNGNYFQNKIQINNLKTKNNIRSDLRFLLYNENITFFDHLKAGI